MKATLVLKFRERFEEGFVIEMVLWRLPFPTEERPHGYKYRFFCGATDGGCLVRYDNEAGKGDHIHYGDVEVPYRFTTADKLQEDFWADVHRLTGGAP